MSEMIELHAEVNADGKMTIHDQHGRRLKGVRAASLITEYNSVNEIALTVVQYVGGQAVNNRKPAMPVPPSTIYRKESDG